MTLGELERAIESKRRVNQARLKEKATFDYIQAELIGSSIARIYSSQNRFPSLEEAYFFIFKDSEELKEIEEKRQEQQAELSAIRFRQFADSHNKRFKKVQKAE